jgi:hypothetical protein
MAASIGFALMLGATVAYITWPMVAGALGTRPAPPPPVPPAYASGEMVDVPVEWYSDAAHTLLIFARQSCAACDKARPFLADLISRVDQRAGVVMAFPTGAEQDDRAFARSIGVKPDRAYPTPAGLRVRATPTLVLIDRSGRIVDAWEGVGDAERQRAIADAVASALR